MPTRRVEAGDASGDAAHAESLLLLALSRPKEAIRRSDDLLARGPTDLAGSYALQALSVAHRELGDTAIALRSARRALRSAQRSGRPERAADVRATLGSTLAMTGHGREALEVLDAALPHVRGVHAARIRVRRGGVLQLLGRNDEALGEVRRALPVLRVAGDTVYEARALNVRALAYDDHGEHTRSDRDLARSEALLRDAGQRLESAIARHNRGHLASRLGDLPAALWHYDAAEEMYAAVDTPSPDLEIDRCRLLLAAGMPDDARKHAARAAVALAASAGEAHQQGEALLTAASAALASGDHATARRDSAAAMRLFARQERQRWALRAERILLLARASSGELSPGLARAAALTADGLAALKDSEAVEARLLAGRLAIGLGMREEAERQLRAAAQGRGRGAAISRATGWLARALQAEAVQDMRTMLSACRRGLDVLDEHRLTMGATEMRARATVHGAELAAIATRHAARSGDAGQLLRWSERWRATTLTAAPVRPPDDDELAAELSTLRGVTTRITEARAESRTTTALEREQARLEASVRSRTLRTRGTSERTPARVDVPALRSALGDATLVDLIEVDGVLHVVTVGPRGVRMCRAGESAVAINELDFARFGLRRVAVSTGAASIRMAMSSLDKAGMSLQEALLGQAVDLLGDGDVVVVPSGRLHAVPWALLPALRNRCVTVAPSITSWLRASATPRPRRHKVALVAGPGLETGGAEVQVAADLYEHTTLLSGSGARASHVLAALDGASLAHVAAHGTFRADNALFSSLRMADGPLTVHDLERLRRAPYRLVLSSCDSGLGTVAGADELLGLASALIGLGTAGLLASVVPVNDAATVPLMVAVHERLRAGDTLAQALHAARASLGGDDPVLQATGWSFIALGGA